MEIGPSTCDVFKCFFLLIVQLWLITPSCNGAVVLPAEAGTAPRPSPTPAEVNCSRAVVKKHLQLDAINPLPGAQGKSPSKPAGPDSNGVEKYGVSDAAVKLLPNCTVDTGSDSEVSVVYSKNVHHWKTKVIVTCTIAAAVEILIVMFIIMYWREIRWTLRKISCSCISRRRQSGSHHTAMSEEAMSDDEETRDVITQTDDVTQYSVRMYSPTDTSQHDSSTAAGDIEELHDTTPV